LIRCHLELSAEGRSGDAEWGRTGEHGDRAWPLLDPCSRKARQGIGMNDFHKLHKNVQVALSESAAEYKVYDHANLSTEIRNSQDFASALEFSIQRITKTLFLCSHGRETYIAAVCSVDRRLDFKSIASLIGVKRVEAASAEDLAIKTGYPRNGVSPLGLGGDIAVMVDGPLLDYSTVLVGGGAVAIEVELSPSDLVRIAGATTHDIT